MIDVKKPVREAYFNLLNGHLTYLGVNVQVTDDVKSLGDPSTMYVILSNQTGASANTFQTFDSTETIALDIVFKATARANKEAVDTVANSILLLVMPSPGITGLISPAGVQINCVTLNDDRYIPLIFNGSNSVVRRILTFKQHVRQT